MNEKLKPTGENILVKCSSEIKMTAGGLHLPQTAKDALSRAEVLAVGRGRLLDNGTVVAPTVNVGNIVLFTTGVGTDVKLNGEDFVIVPEYQILAVFE